MATYAIGDVQGCHDELVLLLDQINFDARHDRLWFTGDLVNRGPKSAQSLRLIKSLGEAATVVLGNHDLFLLSLAAGHGKLHAGDTMQEVLVAADSHELLGWLATRKLAHFEHDTLLVHAGVLPAWNAHRVLELAAEVEHAIQHDAGLFASMRGNQPDAWDESLTGHDRLRVIINALARVRFITPAGHMEFKLEWAEKHAITSISISNPVNHSRTPISSATTAPSGTNGLTNTSSKASRRPKTTPRNGSGLTTTTARI